MSNATAQAAYAVGTRTGATMGIPLRYAWANRLCGYRARLTISVERTS